jgi:uncharacterized repeat protein (TIGR03837 family)
VVRKRWHVFCRVVDNYGDAGVCWRLARQLAAEHALDVTLWIDRLSTLAHFQPGVDATRDHQSVLGVSLRLLDASSVADDLPDVVIEGFGCGLPDPYVAAMASAASPPLWINLEYLSAEPWVETVHGLASPHPRLPLARYFWFPGFTLHTGGLQRERGLLEARDALNALRESREGLQLTLFSYANQALPSLFEFWAEGDERVVCSIPEGVAAGALDQWLHGDVPHAGDSVARGRLSIEIIPFGTQDQFDRLLWRSDVNFVRGEDSFVRAQWAARPFVWQPYRQDEDAHMLKLDAFLTRYCGDLGTDARRAVHAFSHAFNVEDGAAAARAWPAFRSAHNELDIHARRWAAALAKLPELTAGLVDFARHRL